MNVLSGGEVVLDNGQIALFDSITDEAQDVNKAIQQIISSASSDQRKMLITVLDEKCGGPGSGVPGPCPMNSGDGDLWDKPTAEQLHRAHMVFKELTDGPTAKSADAQMRGGILKNGKFTAFDEKTKQTNLKKIKSGLEAIKRKDPEAFEAARQWSIAEMLGKKKYSEVPDTVEVFRGHLEGEAMQKITNVTHIKEVAEKFGAGGVVSSFTINKNDISFPLSNSSFVEGELLIFDTKKLKAK